MGKHQMKTIIQIAAIVAGLTAGGTAMAQDATPAAAAPAQATTLTEDWNPFSRSAVKVYMANVNGFVTTGDVVSVTVAKVPLDGRPGDYSYAADQIEMRCSAKQSRLAYSIEYGPNGVQTDRFDDPEEWAPYAPETRDAYLAQLVCDGDRASPPTWPSIKAFIDAGRH
jgi:hypothetical protein